MNGAMESADRTRRLLGDAAAERLRAAHVTVAGLGAVGSYATEALARLGVGRLALIDFDEIRASNLNRNLFATATTLGRPKTDAAAARVREIAPACVVEAKPLFLDAANVDATLEDRPDVLVDAIDALGPKADLILAAVKAEIPIVSSMGASTRTNPALVRAGDLFSARGCPLARFLRKRLRANGVIGGVRCVYSTERARRVPASAEANACARGRPRETLGSLATVTGIFGLWVAHEVLRRLVGLPEAEAEA